jgi:uncharacterized protein
MSGEARLKRFTDPVEFAARVEPLLARAEAANCLLLGIAANLRRAAQAGNTSGPAPYMATLEQDGQVQLVALRTPPYKLILSTPIASAENPGGEAIPALLAPLVEDVLARHQDLPGVLGPKALSLVAAEMWSRATRKPHRLDVAMRVFELDRVRPPREVPGRLRRATVRDRETVLAWVQAFQRDIGEDHSPADAERVAASRLAPDDDLTATNGTTGTRTAGATRPARTVEALGLYLWEVKGEPVSMAAAGSPTPTGARINLVYTPPERRRNGYASACVATLSQHVLDSGRRFCFLFTDLANPTSNHIYQEIGYRPVVDVDDYVFED